MDNIRALTESLAGWIACHSAPPLIWAAHQKARSLNIPSTFAGFIFQETAVCDDWEIGDQRLAFPAGHLVLLSTHRGAHSAPPRPGGLWICTFDLKDWDGYPPFLEQWNWDPRPIRAPLRLIQAYREVIFHFPLRAQAMGLHFRAAMLRFLATVLEELAADRGRGHRPSLGVHRAIEFLHAHYADPEISLLQLASIAGLSPHHFGRVFRAELGQPPMKYLQSLRIAQGQTLLTTNTEMRVKEVAREVGFPDPLHFSRVFRHVTGQSPRQARNP